MCVNNCKKHNQTVAMSRDVPTQKIGYLEIKQSSKVRGRKLKTWRRRWVVLDMMSKMSSEEYVAKLDVYDNEAKWRNSASDKTTFMLEHVTSIRQSTSRTRPHAFEIAEKHPVLVLSGTTELESFIWMFTFQQMLTPDQIEAKKGTYNVSMLPNEHATKWNLAGELSLSVTPLHISLSDEHDKCVISWGLSTLMKFNVEKEKDTGIATVLIIECGPNAPTGHSCFRFKTREAQEILGDIRQSICFALAHKQTAKRTVRSRTLSATISEKNFEKLLDSHVIFSDFTRDRSGSDSSGSTLFPGSPSTTVPEVGPGTNIIPLRPPRSSDSVSVISRGSPELEALHEAEEHAMSDSSRNADLEVGAKASVLGRDTARVSFREPAQNSSTAVKHYGYSVIKDVSNKSPSSIADSTQETHPDRARSHSAVETGLEAKVNCDWIKSKRSVSFEVEDDADLDGKSDRDSAISSASELSKRELTLPQLMSFPLTHKGRRRSSSTPDLYTSGKYRGSENIYEELDELRASIQRLNKTKENEIPPALPARPLSMNFSAHNDKSSNENENAKKKRFLFNKKGRTTSEPTKTRTRSRSESVGSCNCGELRAERLTSVSDNGQCFACGGDTSVDHRTECSSDDIAGSSTTSVNNVYMSIPDVIQTTKRRRSSDINPVPSTVHLQLRDNFTNTKHATLPRFGAGKNLHSTQNPKPSTQESLINLSDPVDVGSLPATKPLTSNLDDPLISFFLDDATFETNPMVTGQLTPAVPSPPHQDLLSLDGFTESFNQPPTPLTSPNNLFPGQVLGRQNFVQSPTGNDSVMAPPFTPFQVQFPVMFQDTNTNNGFNNFVNQPMVRTNSFPNNPFISNSHNFQINIPPTTQLQENNYVPMACKANTIGHDSIFSNTTVGSNMDFDFFGPRYVPNKAAKEDIYVSPSGISK